MQIIVDGLLTDYDISGHGKLILLLHGWGDNRHGFSEMRARLQGKYQILSIDLPGFGKTQAPPKAWDLDNYAEYVAHVLQKLDLPQPFALIGHSNGGAIAIRATATSTLHPHKLILLASAGVRSGHQGKKTVLKFVAKAGKTATIWLPNRYQKRLRQRLYGAAGSDMLLVPQLEETFKKTVGQDVQSDAMKVTVPTLLIFADKDQAVPVDNGKKLQSLIPHSELEVIPDAGHFVHLEKPEVVERLIEEFLG